MLQLINICYICTPSGYCKELERSCQVKNIKFSDKTTPPVDKWVCMLYTLIIVIGVVMCLT